jgi:hypothetical protein
LTAGPTAQLSAWSRWSSGDVEDPTKADRSGIERSSWLAMSTPPLQFRRRSLMWFGGGLGIHRREARRRVRRCLGDNCQSSGPYGSVRPSQVRLGGDAGESGLVRFSCVLWNDRENDWRCSSIQKMLTWERAEGARPRRQPFCCTGAVTGPRLRGTTGSRSCPMPGNGQISGHRSRRPAGGRRTPAAAPGLRVGAGSRPGFPVAGGHDR